MKAANVQVTHNLSQRPSCATISTWRTYARILSLHLHLPLRLITWKKMNKHGITLMGFVLLWCVLSARTSENNLDRQRASAADTGVALAADSQYDTNSFLSHHRNIANRQKRSFFLKKKILGAGLLGFGLGVAKGYKAGYQHQSPEVHHVYVAAPPVKYVEYVEKPVYIERIVERPVLKHATQEYEPSWSPVMRSAEPSSAYGYD